MEGSSVCVCVRVRVRTSVLQAEEVDYVAKSVFRACETARAAG